MSVCLALNLSAQSFIAPSGISYNGDLSHLNRMGIGLSSSTSFNIDAVLDVAAQTTDHGNLFRVGKLFINDVIPPSINYIPEFIITYSGNVGIAIENPEQRLHVRGNGLVSNNFYVTNRIGIGTNNPSSALHITNGNILVQSGELRINDPNGLGDGDSQILLKPDGIIRAREIKVDLASIPDYVFKPDYNLMPLAELRKYITKNEHLPNIKSSEDYEKEGSIALKELSLKLLEKVEELSLYILQQEEKMKALEKRILNIEK